jgi:hypothetical protein
VNEIPDEWLYNEPTFFNFHEHVSRDTIDQFCEENEYNHHGTVIDNAMINLQGPDGHEVYKSNIAGYIIDVPRNKGPYASTRTFDLKELIHGESLDLCFQEKRTPANSKKRFLHFYPLSQYVALACFLASHERDATASFFDRHASYDGYFSETAVLALNKWVTELHLPFYQISNQEPSSGEYRTIAKMVGTPFMRGNGREGNAIWINRATMSFRFDGDIFDRYWTCYFIEHNPRMISAEQTYRYTGKHNPRSILTRKIEGASKESSWRQRKILELILIELMLEEILRSTKEILMEARLRIERSFRPETITSFNYRASGSTILDPLDLIHKVDNSMFLTTNSLWNELEPIFQLMKGALHENLEIIARWTDRERNRGQNEPQWTLHDESYYRRAIFALQNSNRQKIHELKRCDAEITSFITIFARKLELMRSELDRRGADDIRLFTYVTVVFLPVGFATSVFSMSGTPSTDTLHGMIILAILALLVTLITLINARILDRVLGPIFGACRAVIEATVNPIINGLLMLILRPISARFIHPVSKSVYLLLCRSIYDIAFPLYMRFLSPEDLGQQAQDLGTYDRRIEMDENNIEYYDQDAKRMDHNGKQKHYKQITELGPMRAARWNILNMRSEKRAKEQQKLRSIRKQVKYEKEEEYKEEEKKRFKEKEQRELNEQILRDLSRNFEKQLEDAVEPEFELMLETDMRHWLVDINTRKDPSLKKLLRERIKADLERSMVERFLKEGKKEIWRQTNIIIKDRVKKRIEQEVTKRMDLNRIQNEKREAEEKGIRRQAMKAQKAKSSVVHRFVRKKTQKAAVKQLIENLENGLQQ